MEISSGEIAAGGVVTAVAGAWAVVRYQVRGLVESKKEAVRKEEFREKTREIAQDVNNLGTKIRSIEKRFTLDDGRSRYIARPECDSVRQEMCNWRGAMEKRMDVLSKDYHDNTNRIIEAIEKLVKTNAESK